METPGEETTLRQEDTMASFVGMDAAEARAFAERWLPAWTGGDPDRLLAFYAPDALYADPAIPQGLRGDALHRYLGKLLGANPRWVWTHTGSDPLPGGFVNRWTATIPVGQRTIEAAGVCLVFLNEDGLITKNEVFFDRAPLLEAMRG
jgi:hypothetical protein